MSRETAHEQGPAGHQLPRSQEGGLESSSACEVVESALCELK